MSKFKVGDRVRVTSSDYHRKASLVGREFEIERSEGIYEAEATWSVSDRYGSSPYRWKESELELVTTGPVRTVTRKEIVPGVHGRVSVEDAPECMRGTIAIKLADRIGTTTDGVRHYLTATELRAAAATFTELADALDGVA